MLFQHRYIWGRKIWSCYMSSDRSLANEAIEGYLPSDGEEFMGEIQADYFRKRLLNWREQLLKEGSDTIYHMQEDQQVNPDLIDNASQETDRAIELRTRDRERKLINKIDAALRRLEEGEFGYCQDTGEAIDLPRLIARPIATLSLEAQERHERLERVHRDDRVVS